ncbi:hypothetical protein MTO96_006736 [Rhipicephalus appendiculatus]
MSQSSEDVTGTDQSSETPEETTGVTTDLSDVEKIIDDYDEFVMVATTKKVPAPLDELCLYISKTGNPEHNSTSGTIQQTYEYEFPHSQCAVHCTVPSLPRQICRKTR